MEMGSPCWHCLNNILAVEGLEKEFLFILKVKNFTPPKQGDQMSL
jgi:hypothetical protein